MGELTREAFALLDEVSWRLQRALVGDQPLARLARVRERALRRWLRRLARNA